MNVNNLTTNYDINAGCPPGRIVVSHDCDVNTRTVEVFFRQGVIPLAIDTIPSSVDGTDLPVGGIYLTKPDGNGNPTEAHIIGYAPVVNYTWTNMLSFTYFPYLRKIEFIGTNNVASIGNYVFQNCTSLENVSIADGFNCNNLNLAASTRYSAETIMSWLEALADRTGQTPYTLTIGTTNLNKLTAEQKVIATNKNWTLA